MLLIHKWAELLNFSLKSSARFLRTRGQMLKEARKHDSPKHWFWFWRSWEGWGFQCKRTSVASRSSINVHYKEKPSLICNILPLGLLSWVHTMAAFEKVHISLLKPSRSHSTINRRLWPRSKQKQKSKTSFSYITDFWTIYLEWAKLESFQREPET